MTVYNYARLAFGAGVGLLIGLFLLSQHGAGRQQGALHICTLSHYDTAQQRCLQDDLSLSAAGDAQSVYFSGFAPHDASSFTIESQDGMHSWITQASTNASMGTTLHDIETGSAWTPQAGATYRVWVRSSPADQWGYGQGPWTDVGSVIVTFH